MVLAYRYRPHAWRSMHYSLGDLQKTQSYNSRGSENTFLDPSVYPDLQQKLMGSILGTRPSLRPRFVEINFVVFM